jgi:HAMP domain-containing protein
MKQFFLSLKIRVKLLAAFGSILLLSVILILFSIGSINSILKHKSVNEHVDALKLHLETLELAEKEFLYEEYKSEQFLKEQNSEAVSLFQKSYAASKEIIANLENAELTSADKTLTPRLLQTLDSLSVEFNLLVDLLGKRGFRDYGSEGILRSAIHQVENSGFNIDKATMLTLRRHEKDFFLRKDLRYQEEFNNKISDFRSQLQDDPTLSGLIPYLKNYQSEFANVVEIERQIGLKETDGIRGRVKHAFARIRPELEIFRDGIRKRNEAEILQSKITLGILFSVQLIAGLVMAIVYSNLLTKSIKEIRNGMIHLAQGIFPEKLSVRTTEELGQTKLAFNQFVDRLRKATSFAQQLGSGDLTVQYDSNYADDVLARSLIQAQSKLAEADARQYKINWTNQGIAAFNDILKNENENIGSLADKILKQLVQFLGMNQGALYILERTGTDIWLEREATYAYDKKKYHDHRVDVGQGLLGQCVLEGHYIYLKEIPRDYIKITSGLGEATPRNVIVVPLKVRSVVMGVIELASFQHLEQHHVEFIERIAENIATVLSNKKTNEETRRLLDESQQRANALTQQEEEMRQNSEELLATQEEMNRQRKSLEAEINRLRKEISALRQEEFA